METEIKRGKNLSKKEKDLIVKENIKNFEDCNKVKEELENLKEELESVFFFVKDKDEIMAFGLLKPVRMRYLGKNYNIFGIGNMIAIKKRKGYGTILVKEMKEFLQKRQKTGLGFTGSIVAKFYKKAGLKYDGKLSNRFFYDYGNAKENKEEMKWGGVYYEGKDKFISHVLKTKSIVNIPCMHW